MNRKSAQPKSLVSVIMPVYEPDELRFQMAVKSILSQSYRFLELLIIDDGCSRPLSEITHFRDSRIKIIRLDQNSGRAAARNKGLEHASGNFIAWADDDDVSVPWRFSSQLRYFQKHPEIDFLGGDMVYSNHNPVSPVFRSSNKIRLAFLFRNPVNSPTIMFRRNIIDRGLRFNDHLRLAEDYDFYFRASSDYIFTSMPSILVHYHSNLIRKKVEQETFHANCIRTEAWKCLFGKLPDEMQKLFWVSPKQVDSTKLADMVATGDELKAAYRALEKPFVEDFNSVVNTMIASYFVELATSKYHGYIRKSLYYIFSSSWPTRVKLHFARKIVIKRNGF